MAEASRTFHTILLPSFSHLHKAQSLAGFTAFPRKRCGHRIVVHCSVSTTNDASRTKTTVTQNMIPWGCEIDSLENASTLQKWLSDSGLPPQKMAIQKVDVGERGLVALKNIRKGEKLLFVPPSLVITADSVKFFLVLLLLKHGVNC